MVWHEMFRVFQVSNGSQVLYFSFVAVSEVTKPVSRGWHESRDRVGAFESAHATFAFDKTR